MSRKSNEFWSLQSARLVFSIARDEMRWAINTNATEASQDLQRAQTTFLKTVEQSRSSLPWSMLAADLLKSKYYHAALVAYMLAAEINYVLAAGSGLSLDYRYRYLTGNYEKAIEVLEQHLDDPDRVTRINERCKECSDALNKMMEQSNRGSPSLFTPKLALTQPAATQPPGILRR